jgi:hypothetical protein
MTGIEYPYVPRRVITGVRDGKSVFVSDGPTPNAHVYDSLPGMMSSFVYATAPAPMLPVGEAETAAIGRSVVPGPGETTLVIITFPPGSTVSEPDFNTEAWITEQSEHMPGLLQYFEADGMHRTPTIDYDIVLDGEMWLALDDETRSFRTGDVAIQGAARHSWRNLGDKAATMCFVFVGGTESVAGTSVPATQENED